MKLVHQTNSPVRCVSLLPPRGDGEDIVAIGYQDGTLCLRLANRSAYLTGILTNESGAPEEQFSVQCWCCLMPPCGDGENPLAPLDINMEPSVCSWPIEVHI